MIGVIGVMVRRNIIIIFMSIELILNAVNINLVAFSKQLQNAIGQVFAVFVIAVAAAEAAVGPRHHPGVLPEQGNGQHRRDEPDAMVGGSAIWRATSAIRATDLTRSKSTWNTSG